jgi:hypothetical protein
LAEIAAKLELPAKGPSEKAFVLLKTREIRHLLAVPGTEKDQPEVTRIPTYQAYRGPFLNSKLSFDHNDT